MDKVFSIKDTLDHAADFFGVYTGKKPDLIPTGIPAIDEDIGGLSPGTCGLLAAKNGSGKSSIMLTAALSSPVPVGIISCEDTPDVVGSRLLSTFSGVNSLRMRRGELTSQQREKIRKGHDHHISDHVYFRFCIGSTIDKVLESVEELAAVGCRLVWLDYAQKIRAPGEDRRSVVAGTYTSFQAACARNNMAGMVLSQISRNGQVKETSDMEDECRLFIFSEAEEGSNMVISTIRKSTVGMTRPSFAMRRDGSGVLRFV